MTYCDCSAATSSVYKGFVKEGLTGRVAMHSDGPLHPKPLSLDELLSDESSDFPPIKERESSAESPVCYLNQSYLCF